MSPILSSLVAVAALRGTIDASARTEVRVRNANDGSATSDLETTLNVLVGLRSRQWETTLALAPRITLRGDVGPSPDFMQGFVFGATHGGRRASISLYEEGSYGRQSFFPFLANLGAPPETKGVGTLPSPLVINYASSRTGILARLAPARRWGLRLSLEHALSGGADARSRASIPLQSGPRGSLLAEYALTRRDHLTSALSLSFTGFSSGPEDVLVQATESWRRTLGRNTESTLVLGAAWATARAGPSDLVRSAAHPIAEATIAHRIPSLRVDVRATGRLSPVIDPMSGRVDERLESAGGASWSPARWITISGQLGAAQSIAWARPGAATMVFHALTVTYRAGKIVQVDGGARGFWWGTRGADALPPQWITFAGLTFTAPEVRF